MPVLARLSTGKTQSMTLKAVTKVLHLVELRSIDRLLTTLRDLNTPEELKHLDCLRLLLPGDRALVLINAALPPESP